MQCERLCAESSFSSTALQPPADLAAKGTNARRQVEPGILATCPVIAPNSSTRVCVDHTCPAAAANTGSSTPACSLGQQLAKHFYLLVTGQSTTSLGQYQSVVASALYRHFTAGYLAIAEGSMYFVNDSYHGSKVATSASVGARLQDV